MMQQTKEHNNRNHIPKQSKTYPTQKKAEESEDEPMPLDYKNKVKTITSSKNPNLINFELNNGLSLNNQIVVHNVINNNKQNIKFEEEGRPQNFSQVKNNSNSMNSNIVNNQGISSENNIESAKFINSNNENAKNSLNLNEYGHNLNNYSGKLKSDKGSIYNEAAYASSSGSNIKKNFKANTTEYALNSNNTSNQNLNSFSMRQNKVNRHTYTKLAERMKSEDKKFKNNNENKTRNYVKNKTDYQGKFTSEIFNNLNNQVRKSSEKIFNKENNYKENTPVNYNSNLNSAENTNTKINHNYNNSEAYCENDDQDRKGLINEHEQANKNDDKISPRSINSKINKNDQTNMGIEKLDPQMISHTDIDSNASLNKSQSSKQKNSTMTDFKFNINKAPENINNNINNLTEKDLINNYNPNLISNKLANFKKFEEENIMEPSMQKLDYSVSDDQLDKKQKAVKANSDVNIASNSNGLLNPNIVFYDKNNTNLSVSGNNQNSNFNSINNTNTNLNATDNNYQTTNNLKTINSKAQVTDSKFAQYDTQQLCYELVKEYAHLKIDKDEDFMRRMLFDIFKRQTKEERLEKLIEKNKVKINENDRIKTFNRLIEDANRRIEAQDHMEEMRMKLERTNVINKKYKYEEWEEIYNDRFLRHQKYKYQWIEERQNEKKRQEELHEQELVELCKTIKKPKEEIENFVQRMYNEAERRQIKFETKRNKNPENKINIDDFISRANLDYHPKSPNHIVSRHSQRNKNKQTKYQFQSDMSGNENSEEENNFLSKLKELKEKNLSNSPAVRKSPQRQLYTYETNLIKESANEGDLEENSTCEGNYRNDKTDILRTLENRNNFHNEKCTKISDKKKNLSVNKYSNNNYNTEINNRRFEIDPAENKRNIVMNHINRNTPKNNLKAEKSVSSKQYKSKNNNPINIYSEHLKNIQEFEQRNFLMEEDGEHTEAGVGFKINLPKRPFSKNSHANQANRVNTNMRHMPDHLATKLVDDILNAKFSQD